MEAACTRSETDSIKRNLLSEILMHLVSLLTTMTTQDFCTIMVTLIDLKML